MRREPGGEANNYSEPILPVLGCHDFPLWKVPPTHSPVNGNPAGGEWVHCNYHSGNGIFSVHWRMGWWDFPQWVSASCLLRLLRSAPRCTLTKCLWSSAAASGIVRVALSAPFSSFCVLVEQMLFTAVKSCALPMSLHTYFPIIFIKLREILKIKKNSR